MKTLIAHLVLATGLLANSSMAELTEKDILLAQDCPEGISVDSKKTDGMIAIVVRIDPDKVEKNRLYAGKISAICELELFEGGERVASIPVKSCTENAETVFRLSMSQAAARSSHLKIFTRLHENSAKSENEELTLGGGRIVKIFLAGFLPDNTSVSEQGADD